jgi:hypothetical protein
VAFSLIKTGDLVSLLRHVSIFLIKTDFLGGETVAATYISLSGASNLRLANFAFLVACLVEKLK